jgi:hypothetical protein
MAKVRRYVLLFGLLLLGVMGTVHTTSTHAAATIVTTSIDSPISLVVPCALQAAGEEVALSGSLHDLFHVTFDGAGHFHFDMHENPQGVSGVGLTSGVKYQGAGGTRFDANGTAGSRFVITVVNNLRIIGQGPGNNFMVHDNLHVTVNPDGTVTSSHDNVSTTCQ